MDTEHFSCFGDIEATDVFELSAAGEAAQTAMNKVKKLAKDLSKGFPRSPGRR